MGDRRCCCGCWHFSDDFNRDDNDDLGSAWEELSGDWDIDDDQLSCVSAGLVLCQRTTPTEAQYAQVRLNNVVSGDIYGLVLASDDAAVSYHSVEIEFSEVGEDLIGTLRLKYGATVLEESGPLIVSDPSFVLIDGWIDSDWFCGYASHIGGACTTVKTAPNALDGCYGGLYATSGTWFDNYYLSDHYVHNPVCPDCACVCTQDGVVHRMPFELLLTISGDHTCSTASGEVTLQFEGGDCYNRYVNLDDATGCLEGWSFELSCEFQCDSGDCVIGTLWVQNTVEPLCLYSSQLQKNVDLGSCYPVSMQFSGASQIGCPCCTGPSEPPPIYNSGTLYFDITEKP